MNLRHFLQTTGLAITGAATLPGAPIVPMPKGKAEHVIFIWLGGGMAQIDTFDPKRRGDSKASPKVAGSEYAAIDTAVPGVQFCEHLPQTAKLADRLTVMRTINHKVVDEHAFATNFVHTGRPISGSITYPSVGSITSHVLGAVDPKVPPYMLIGYPNVSRGPGYLGAKAATFTSSIPKAVPPVSRAPRTSHPPGPNAVSACSNRSPTAFPPAPFSPNTARRKTRPFAWPAPISCGTFNSRTNPPSYATVTAASSASAVFWPGASCRPACASSKCRTT